MRFIKWIAIIGFFLIISACGDGISKAEEQAAFTISILNHSDLPIKSMEIHTQNQTIGVAHADGSLIEKGEYTDFEWMEGDLTGGGDLEIMVDVILEDGQRLSLSQSYVIELDEGKSVQFELVGSSKKDVSISGISVSY